MEEKVDILLTTYNTKPEYLKLQIDSILEQTYKNFNLIISDDCSSNEEVKNILDEYAKKDERIKLYFQKNNLGCTKNFEFLLNQSESEYIMFSDHDDIWHLDKIEKSLKALKEQDVDLVYSDAIHIDGDGNIISNSYLKNKKLAKVSGKFNLQTISRHFAIGCSQMFTKKVKENMIPFSENTKVHDWHSVYIANCLKGIYYIDEPLLKYRLHENNIVGGRSFNQNLKTWTKENGKGLKSFVKYRYKVITETYLSGAKMCIEYNSKIADETNKEELEKMIEEEKNIIQYYGKSQNTKFIYFAIHKYFKYLYFKGIGSRFFKEIVMLHFPIFSFIVFCIK